MSDIINPDVELAKLREQAGAILHPDQTTKQPVVWRCSNPECSEHKFLPIPFDFQSEYPICPKCKSEGLPNVTKRALTHLLLKNPKGKIEGQHGRYSMACDHKRDYLATHTNGEAATDQLAVVNCPGCLRAVINQQVPIQGVKLDVKNLPTAKE